MKKSFGWFYENNTIVYREIENMDCLSDYGIFDTFTDCKNAMLTECRERETQARIDYDRIARIRRADTNKPEND